MQALRSALSTARDALAPISHTSTFRQTGQITPEEFILAGDYLVYKFPSWSWSSASPSTRSVAYLPADKQYLVTRGVPCRRRLDDDFAGGADGERDAIVRDGFAGAEGQGEDDGWLRTGGSGAEGKGMESSGAGLVGGVRTLNAKGEEESFGEGDEDDVPDMEDEDDDEDAIIREPHGKGTAPLRTYTLYITYTPYYRTPRMYLSGYSSANTPLPPTQMLDDIVGDYKDKTVTLEDFPFFDAGVKMASVHPCRHASVMKVLLDRADAALKIRRDKERARREKGLAAEGRKADGGSEGLVGAAAGLSLDGKKAVPATSGADEWEVLDEAAGDGEDEVAIRVDQYVVVFLKFMATLMPSVEHDYTTSV